MTETQWNEFVDKLDFVELTDRWNLLPLHWLDEELPSNLSEAGKNLASNLLEARNLDDDNLKLERVKELCSEYRKSLSSQSKSLDSRLTPPGSRVTLSFLNLNSLGEGDCLITLGSWDRVGHCIAEKAHPGEDHTETVGDEPVRKEPGALNYRHLLLFPDKGKPSPRSFRSLVEKTLRQARGLGARSLSLTHLHLPQTGLADRFAAAEVVSAVRQMLRESPGTTVDILTYTHRNFEDYDHWFESLKSLTKAEEEAEQAATEEPPAEPPPESDDSQGEFTDALRGFAKRSSELASEATASVKGWFSSSKEGEEATAAPGDVHFPFALRCCLNELFLKRDVEERDWNDSEPGEHYVHCLQLVVRCETGEVDPHDLLPTLEQSWQNLGPAHPLHRYYRLLALRIQDPVDTELLESLSQEAEEWEDHPLSAFLRQLREDTTQPPANRILPPVYPSGSRLNVLS